MKRVSLCMAVWNTAHLLEYTLHTLTQQTYDNFEVIIVDDFSEDDVEAVVAPYYDKLDIKVHHLSHDLGMRGNSVSFNVAFSLATGEILMENTPEIMLYPDCISDMVSALEQLGSKSWVSVRTYNLPPEAQLEIDTVDWDMDIYSVKSLPKFNDAWCQNNLKEKFFGTHQTCAIYREDWFKYVKRFPFYLDYGSDDPFYAGVRERQEFTSATIEPMVVHGWHAPIAFWMSQGKAPNWNRWGHTMKNHYNDPLVPKGGTAQIWDVNQDGGPNCLQSLDEINDWKKWKQTVIDTGFKRKDGMDW